MLLLAYYFCSKVIKSKNRFFYFMFNPKISKAGVNLMWLLILGGVRLELSCLVLTTVAEMKSLVRVCIDDNGGKHADDNQNEVNSDASSKKGSFNCPKIDISGTAYEIHRYICQPQQKYSSLISKLKINNQMRNKVIDFISYLDRLFIICKNFYWII